MYGISSKEALREVLKGTYNTYLSQTSELWLLNPTERAAEVSVSMVRSNAAIVLNNAPVTIPAFSSKVVNLNNYEQASRYGVVTVQSSASGPKVVTWIKRIRGVEYVIPTPVR